MTHPHFRFTSGLLWTLVLCAATIVLGDYLFFQQNQAGAAIGLYNAVLLVALLVRRPAVRRNGKALAAVAAAFLFTGAMILDTSFLSWMMFWIAASMATLLPSVKRFDDGWQWFQRLFLHGFRTLIAPLLDALRVQKVRQRAPNRRIRASRIFALLALPLGGSVLIIILFAAANPVIDQLLSRIFAPDLRNLSIGRMILWSLLFIMAWGLLRPKMRKPLLPTLDGRGDLAIPGVSVASVTLSLIAFNLLFALQNLMDLAYMGGFVPLPEGMTLAGYAHRGAYPLIMTALLAALFVLVTLRPGSTTANRPAIRTLVLLWIGQNIVLVASSMIRLIDYVETYSLTPLRIVALAWMVLVAIGLLLICWRMIFNLRASWLINASLGFTALFLTAACFTDLSATSAWWNVRHAREVGGRGVNLDLCHLTELGDSALLPLIALERRTDLKPDFRERVQSVRQAAMDRLVEQLTHGEWTVRRQHRYKLAMQGLAGLKPIPMKPGRRDCAGALLPPDPATQPTEVAPTVLPVQADTRTVKDAPALTVEKQP